MKNFKNVWQVVGGCLFAVGLMSTAGRAAYNSTDIRLPSPVDTSTNAVTYSTPGGVYQIDSFFDIFVDLERFAPPPLPPGASETHAFFDVFTELHLQGPGLNSFFREDPCCRTIKHKGKALAGSTAFYDTEMLQLDLSGGTLPSGVMLRESPTLASTGQTRIDSIGGGVYHIDSFFDVFTELSIDGGATWTPGNTSLHLEGGAPEPTSAVLALLGMAALSQFGFRRGNR